MRSSVVSHSSRALLTAALAFVTCFSPLRAQGQGERSGRGYFQAGFHQLDLDALNTRLRSQGIPAFEDGFFTFGAGAHAEIGRLMIGGEGHFLLEHSETSSAHQRKLSGGTGFFDVGYVVARPQRARAFALVGLGGGSVTLRAAERALPTFDEALAEPGRSSDLTIGGMLAQLGIGGDVILRRSEDARGFLGLSLGVRAGYVFGPWSAEWQLKGAEAPGGPRVQLGGPYVRVSVGAGGGRR